MKPIFKGTFFFLLSWSLCAQSDIQTIGTLPRGIKETSGLLFYNDKLITHNDSGNAPALYELDPVTLDIARTVRITNAENIDWEDLTQDENFIYIGDIGNNNGDRQDLAILRISKMDYNNNDDVSAERISFQYEDQIDFTSLGNSDYDAEALFIANDHIIVLTKQWQSQGVVAYRIPKRPGSFIAERIDAYQVNGLVTGATFDDTRNILYLVGYSSLLAPFFVSIPAVSATSIFGSERIKANLPIGLAQVEAITVQDSLFYVTSEEFTTPLVNSPSRLFSFTLDGSDGEGPSPNPVEIPEIVEGVVAYKSSGSNQLFYALTTERPIFGRGIFDMQGRLIQYTPLERITENPIDISALHQGLYYLAFFFGDSVISSPFFRD
ncbi:MAG: T9SS C-terminal target domain-containing protein [Croceivirga sp.]